MEHTLKRLFDYQRFEQNEDLRQVIDSVHARYAVRELSLDELSGIAAAGDPALMKKQDEENSPK